MEQVSKQLERILENQKSNEISRNTPPVPDRDTAAILSSLVDRSRAAMGWNRLPEKEQDIAIITWYEILIDAGVPVVRFTDCYRSAQVRRSEQLSQGKEPGIITPNDLAVEWRKLREMHDELNGVKLLPENAAASCQRCFGTGNEEMSDESVRPNCQHLPLTEDEIKERQQVKAQKIADMLAEMKKRPAPKPIEPEIETPKGVKLRCSVCGRKVNTLEGWQIGEICNALIESTPCDGQMVLR